MNVVSASIIDHHHLLVHPIMHNEYSGTSSSSDLPTALSIVRALDNFLESIENMRNTVMVPSRLKGTDVSVLPLLQPSSSSKESSSTVLISRNATSADLFSFYRILHTIHQELTCGRSDLDFGAPAIGTAPVDDEEDTQKLKIRFRQHLHGMFSALQQLTDAANQLSRHYQEQIGTIALD